MQGRRTLRLSVVAVATALVLAMVTPAVAQDVIEAETPSPNPTVEPVEPAVLYVEVDSWDGPVEGAFGYSLSRGLALGGSTAPTRPIAADDLVELEDLEPGPYVLRLEELAPDHVPDFVECYIAPSEQGDGDYLRSADGVAALAFELPPGGYAQCELYVTYVEPVEISAPEPPSASPGPSGSPEPSATPEALVSSSSSSGDDLTDASPGPDESAAPGPSPGPDESAAPGPSTEPDERPVGDVLAPKPGRWRSAVAKSAIVCGGTSVALPRQVETGPIQVKRNGRRIVVAGEVRIVLDQVKGEPGHYRGTVKDRSLGRVVPLKYDVRVLDPEHMQGTLRARFKEQGRPCTLERAWDSSYVGK